MAQYTKEEYNKIVHDTYDKILHEFHQSCDALKYVSVETWIAGLYDCTSSYKDDYAEPTYKYCYLAYGDEPNRLWWDANIIINNIDVDTIFTKEKHAKLQNFLENLIIDDMLNIDMEYFYDGGWVRINEDKKRNNEPKLFFDKIYSTIVSINNYIDKLLK